MKWTFASTGMIIVGLFGILIIILFHEITVSNEQDYYTLREATEASMIEAIDSTYYRLTGKLKMNEEKFIENFTKRFIKSSTFGQGNYHVDFYQINEYPAKVSLRIIDDTNSYNIFTTFDESIGATQARIVNELSAIIDGYEIEDKYDFVKVLPNELSGPPPVINGCVAQAPDVDCHFNSDFQRQLDSDTEGKYNVVKTTTGCVVYMNVGAPMPIPIEYSNITTTCKSGYHIDTSGWCVC